MKVSDEIRKWSSTHCGKSIDKDDCEELLELAKRIDHEMAALPRNKDGKVFHVGTR